MSEEEICRLILDSIKENCCGMEVNSIKDLYDPYMQDCYDDRVAFNAVCVIEDILTKLNFTGEDV